MRGNPRANPRKCIMKGYCEVCQNPVEAVWVVDQEERHWGHGNDVQEEGHYECPECGEEPWHEDDCAACYGCGEYLPIDQLHKVDGDWYCDNCRVDAQVAHVCSLCDKIVKQTEEITSIMKGWINETD